MPPGPGAVVVWTGDVALGSALTGSLTAAGYAVGLAATAFDVMRLAHDLRLRCLVLDLVLPDGTATAALARLRADPALADVPVIVLTPAGIPHTDPAVPSGVRALPKPLDPAVLAQAVDETLAAAPVPDLAGLRVNLRALTAHWGQSAVPLTPTEARLLAVLLERQGQPVSVSDLLAAVWSAPPTAGGTELVRVHVRNLRAKLATLTDAPVTVIRTIVRQGYMVPHDIPVARPAGRARG